MQASHSSALETAAAVGRLPLEGGAALVTRGTAGGTPILFLHGVAGAAWSWAPQAVALAGSRRTYAWEARGHGETARVADAGLAEYFEDAQQALAHVARSEGRSVIIAAHSLGGLLALALAASRPAEVAALFLIEPVYVAPSTPLLPLGAFGPLTVFAPAMLPFILALAEGFRYDLLAARAYARSIFESSFHDRIAMERAWEHQRRQTPVEYRQILLELAGASTRFQVRRFAREIALPVYLLEGTNVLAGMHFPNLVEELRGLGSDFTHRVVSGGHYLQLDREPAVTAELLEFVARVAPD